MRITVYSNDGSSSRQVADKLTNKLINNGFTMDAQTPEVVISVGGDGTLLSAFHRYADALDQIRFIGVHTGHLGFYTDWRDFEVDDLVVALQEDLGQDLIVIGARNDLRGRRRTERFLWERGKLLAT